MTIKILLAADGSESALRATRKLIETRHWYREAPVVVLVSVHLAVPLASRAAHVLGPAAVEGYYRDELEAALKPSRDALAAVGIQAIEHTAVGEPAAEIARIAESEGCDLIFMGTRGMGAVRNLILGSTATKVLHLAQVPVTLVH